MKVFHIEKNELEFTVGDLIQPRIYNLNSFAPKKKEVEDKLETIRKDKYPDYPSRLNCLYVCYNLEDVEFWAIQKSDIYGREFKVLTLETSEPVYWFSADSYNMYFCGQRNDLHQSCVEFWESNRKTVIDKLADREGLTNGVAIVVEIMNAKVSRERGLELF